MENLSAKIDATQIRQAMNNLLQNAVDSIAESSTEEGKIRIVMGKHGIDEVFIAVSDNGPGFPKGENPEKLTEPYVTRKHKGTGLGLAIVKKIMEDHDGRLVLGTPEWLKSQEGWSDPGGATILLLLPLERQAPHKEEAA